MAQLIRVLIYTAVAAAGGFWLAACLNPVGFARNWRRLTGKPDLCPGCGQRLREVYCQWCGWNRSPAWSDLPR